MRLLVRALANERAVSIIVLVLTLYTPGASREERLTNRSRNCYGELSDLYPIKKTQPSIRAPAALLPAAQLLVDPRFQTRIKVALTQNMNPRGTQHSKYTLKPSEPWVQRSPPPWSNLVRPDRRKVWSHGRGEAEQGAKQGEALRYDRVIQCNPMLGFGIAALLQPCPQANGGLPSSQRPVCSLSGAVPQLRQGRRKVPAGRIDDMGGGVSGSGRTVAVEMGGSEARA